MQTATSESTSQQPGFLGDQDQLLAQRDYTTPYKCPENADWQVSG